MDSLDPDKLLEYGTYVLLFGLGLAPVSAVTSRFTQRGLSLLVSFVIGVLGFAGSIGYLVLAHETTTDHRYTALPICGLLTGVVQFIVGLILGTAGRIIRWAVLLVLCGLGAAYYKYYYL